MSYLWTPLVFPLWSEVQFWLHYIFVAFQTVSCWKRQVAFYPVWSLLLCIIESFSMDIVPMPGCLFGSFSLVDLVWPHSPTRLGSGASNSLCFAQMSIILNHPQKSAELFDIFEWINCKYHLTLLSWDFIPSLVIMYAKHSVSSVQERTSLAFWCGLPSLLWRL